VYGFCNSYIVLFDPHGALLPTILTAAQNYIKVFKHLKWGSAVTLYPDPATVYHRSAISNPGSDMFEDLFLDDMWVSCCVTIEVD
jgi:hypothetical protein